MIDHNLQKKRGKQSNLMVAGYRFLDFDTVRGNRKTIFCGHLAIHVCSLPSMISNWCQASGKERRRPGRMKFYDDSNKKVGGNSLTDLFY